MCKTDRIQVRIDPETKESASELFNKMGFTMSDAITLFIKQSLKEGCIPFNIPKNVVQDSN